MSTAWIFPGQGSQVVGMGRDLWEQYPASRAIFDIADTTLGFELSQICFEGPASTLTATENAQPALLTTSIAVLAALGWDEGQVSSAKPEFPLPAFTAGHSLGEYSALVAAGALPFTTALKLVRQRGCLMAAATEGTMAAVLGLDMQSLRDVCNEAQTLGPVVIANENAPGQLVISGAGPAVAHASEIAKMAGASRVLPLKVSAAFHSPLMLTASNGLQPAIEQAEMTTATIPIVANVTALPITTPAEIRAELTQQVTASVRWITTIEYMVQQGVDRFIEIGPGSVLAGLVKRIAPDAERISIGDAPAIAKYTNGSLHAD